MDVRSYIFDKFGMSWPVKSPGVIHALLHHDKINACYGEYKKCYYVDKHEDPENVLYRNDFNKRDAEIELLEHKWIQLPQKDADELIEAHAKKQKEELEVGGLKPFMYKDEKGEAMAEFNVNRSTVFDKFVKDHPMGGNLSVRKFPQGPRADGSPTPVIKIGQDEKCYAAFAYPKNAWSVGGEMVLRPKTEGPKEMVSGFVSRVAHIGLPVTKAQLDAINEHRSGSQYEVVEGTDVGEAWLRLQTKAGIRNPTRDKPPLEECDIVKTEWRRGGVPDEDQWVAAPGLRWLVIGKAREGYWTHDNTLVHVVDMIDVFDVLYGIHSKDKPWFIGYVCQAMFHFDWSSGHGAMKEGALCVNNMNLKYGGAQSITHDTVIKRVFGFLGPYSAKATLRGQEVDYKLKVGETQPGAFLSRSHPPFYDLAKEPGTGVRTAGAVTTPDIKSFKEYKAFEEILAKNKECEDHLASSNGPVDFSKLKCPELRSYIRVRLPIPDGKLIASDPKGLKVALVAEASLMQTENKPVTFVLGEVPAGYVEWKSNASERERLSEVNGWLNEPKGLKQYLFERGFWHPSNTQTLDGTVDQFGQIKRWEEELVLEDGTTKKIFVSSSLRECAKSLHDFANEITQLEQLVIDLGHRMDKSPKYHPEIAGEGIELCWGKSAYEFRHNTNNGSVPHLRKNAMKALGPLVLFPERIRRFERMIWRYKQVYRHFSTGDATPVEHEEIERLQKVMKNHRGCDYELRQCETKLMS